MTQTLATVLLFVVLLAAVPALVRRLKARGAMGLGAAGPDSKVISAVAVGPQQRVVTVEVGPPNARTWLVLGVTPQAIVCLHHMPPSAMPASVPGASGDATLAVRAP